MDDLISRKYLYDKIAELEADVRKTIVHQPKGSPEYLRCQSRLNELNEFKSEVRDAPTVEAKEVVHGKWIYNEYYTWECGNCGFHPFKGFIPKEPGFNYCPNCGCDMRTSAE